MKWGTVPSRFLWKRAQAQKYLGYNHRHLHIHATCSVVQAGLLSFRLGYAPKRPPWIWPLRLCSYRTGAMPCAAWADVKPSASLSEGYTALRVSYLPSGKGEEGRPKLGDVLSRN